MTVRTSRDAINLREKLSELDKPSGIAGQDILKADTPQEVFNYIGAGRRNLVINGDFQVWQRGTSQTSTGYGSADRFTWVGTSSSGTISKETSDLPDGEHFTNAVRMENTGSGTQIYRQVIEDGYSKYGTSNKPLTLSAWVKCISGVFAIDIADTSGQLVVEPNGEWQYVSITSSKAHGNSYSPHTYIDMELNGVGECLITGLQLEVGSVATPFEHRSYGEELALCQRYYYETAYHARISVDAKNTYLTSNWFGFPVFMRAAPSVTLSFPWQGVNFNSGTLSKTTEAGISVGITGNGNTAGYAAADVSFSADAEL